MIMFATRKVGYVLLDFIFFSDSNEKNDTDWHSVTKTCTWIWRQPRQTIDTLAII